MTWHEAQTHCRHAYTDLATISNIHDMIEIIRTMGVHLMTLWIGLYEDAVTWKWSLSRRGFYGYREAEFRNWDAVEPYNPNATERCVGIAATGEWMKLNCTSLNYFFCYDGNILRPGINHREQFCTLAIVTSAEDVMFAVVFVIGGRDPGKNP